MSKKASTGRPILIAVGGDSGSGKTTLVSGLARIFGAGRITNIPLDDYHALDRAARKRSGITALNPAANHVDLMVEQIWRLRRGETIEKPTYDHGTGTLGPTERVTPREIVVVRGLFPLYSEELRGAYDLRIWLDPQEELKWAWKVRRDCTRRGYSVPEVIRQIMERRTDYLAHIAPQKAHADIVVQFHAPQGYFLPGTSVENDDAHLNVRILLHRRLPRLDLDDVLAAARADGDGAAGPAIRLDERRSADGDGVRLDGTAEAAPFRALEIDGTVAPARARELDERIWAHMETHRHLRPEELGRYDTGGAVGHSDPLALTQLLIAYQVVRAGLTPAAGAAAQAAAPAGAVADSPASAGPEGSVRPVASRAASRARRTLEGVA